MVARPDDLKPERSRRLQHLPLGHIVRKLHLDGDFGNEGLHDVVVLERIVPEGLDMELDGRFHLSKCFFVGLLRDDNAFETRCQRWDKIPTFGGIKFLPENLHAHT